MLRRDFISLAAAGLAAPTLVSAQSRAYDPTPQYVRTKDSFGKGALIVAPRKHYLYWFVDTRKAIRYGIGVGRAGLQFKGSATIAVKKEWPTWRPTPSMIERNPRIYTKFIGNDYVQPGGKGNPLGARALYLFKNGRDTYFRIHGTTAPESIGRSTTNGCIRMLNEHVIDLYNRVPIGTVVQVV